MPTPIELLDFARRVVEDYFVASSIDEAIGYLTAHHGQAQVVGGGTWLMPRVQRGESRIVRLVDVSRIGVLRRLAEDGPRVVIGGATTFARLAESALVRADLPLVHQAARAMGTPGVRRLATLAGNVVAAVGNAHGAVALLALDAEVEITNLTGPQWLPIGALFVSSGVSRVNATSEIVTAFRVRRAQTREGNALVQTPPAGPWDRAALLVAVNVGLDDSAQTVARAAVAAGWEGSAPLRVRPIERALVGLPGSRVLSEAALLATMSEAAFGGAAMPPERRANIARLVALALPRAIAHAVARVPAPPA
jgi:carbon-monoxide dehydrogenase medium subunit